MSYSFLHLHFPKCVCVCAVPNKAIFCSALTSFFPGMLLRYLLNDFEMISVVTIITGITFAFTLHICSFIIINIIIIIIIIIIIKHRRVTD